jgi:endonuclease YncB( thermonuclease family)
VTECRSLKVLVFLLFLAFALTARADYLLANVVQVHDGDTITVSLAGSAASRGKPRLVRVRLNGIDAPELAQPYGLASRDHLAAAVLNKKVMLTTVTMDRYGRIVAKVTSNGVDECLDQLNAGAAWLYTQYLNSLSQADRPAYIKATVDAHEQHRGLWALDAQIPPWDWRKQHPFHPLSKTPSP